MGTLHFFLLGWGSCAMGFACLVASLPSSFHPQNIFLLWGAHIMCCCPDLSIRQTLPLKWGKWAQGWQLFVAKNKIGTFKQNPRFFYTVCLATNLPEDRYEEVISGADKHSFVLRSDVCQYWETRYHSGKQDFPRWLTQGILKPQVGKASSWRWVGPCALGIICSTCPVHYHSWRKQTTGASFIQLQGRTTCRIFQWYH